AFNAATPNSAWRSRCGLSRQPAPVILQCGHAEFGVEIAGAPASLPRASSAFNAATPNSAWRSALGVGDEVAEQVLQCGHAEFGVEIACAWTAPTSCTSTFNAATPNSAWRSTTTRRTKPPYGPFNAATPNSAWRSTGPPPVVATGMPLLQCGHAEFGVE